MTASDPKAADRCPKCDADVAPSMAACPRCGLARQRFDGFEQDSDSAPAHLQDAWTRVEQAWDDERVHGSFLELCAAASAYSYAGRCYRAASREHGPDHPRVVAGLARVRTMAEAALLPAKPADPAGRRAGRNKALVLIVLLVLVAAVGALTVMLVQRIQAVPGDRGELTHPVRRNAGPASSPADSPQRKAGN